LKKKEEKEKKSCTKEESRVLRDREKGEERGKIPRNKETKETMGENTV